MFQSCTDAYVLDVFTLSLLHQPEEGETGKTFKCLPRREKEENLQISLPVGGTGKTFKSLHHHPEVELSMLVPNGEGGKTTHSAQWDRREKKPFNCPLGGTWRKLSISPQEENKKNVQIVLLRTGFKHSSLHHPEEGEARKNDHTLPSGRDMEKTFNLSPGERTTTLQLSPGGGNDNPSSSSRGEECRSSTLLQGRKNVFKCLSSREGECSCVPPWTHGTTMGHGD